MLKDADFSKNAAVDRYGRKLRKDDTKKQLEKFYRLEDDEGKKDDDDEEDEEDGDGVVAPESGDDDEEVQKELKRVDERGYDPARDGGFSESSSDEESSSESEDEEVDVAEDGDVQYPDQRGESVPMGEVTTRIAVVNLDWDNIRAEDLMAVFSSFTPTGGQILKVSVYPSEFGKERMEREEMEGPPKEIFASEDKEEEFDSEDSESGEDEDDEDDDEKIKESILKEDTGEEFNSAHLRRYQLERLRYYYAILTCSSKEAAKVIYDAVDGTEYLTSANFFDLRFVPDETDFSDDIPRDECERLPDGYKPNDFVTDALQHSKVKLTWDADDAARKQAQAKAFRGARKDIDENDLKAYLGSDSSDDEEDDEEVEVVDSTSGNKSASKMSKKEAERQRMRALLGLGSEPETKPKNDGPVGDMEISFSAGLTASKPRDSVFENEPEKEETAKERYIRKERERKQRRKAKRTATAQPDKGETQEAEMPEEKDKEPEADLGFDDPFFTAPEHDKAAANAMRKEEKKKKREQRAAEEAASAAQRAELELLMVDDKKTGIQHFDMNEIEKAEKRARKSGKKGKKGKKGDDKEEAAKDDFKMDVKDPRFSSLFESHEFAIDPTNPRFKKTEGMKALLEEGRKRRRNVDEDDAGEVERPVKKKQKDRGIGEKTGGGEDLKKLVDQVKKKAKKQ